MDGISLILASYSMYYVYNSGSTTLFSALYANVTSAEEIEQRHGLCSSRREEGFR